MSESFLASYCQIDDIEGSERVRLTIQAVKDAGHHVYKCIERGMFASPRLEKHPVYTTIQKRFGETDFRFLELGCCFGTDSRKLLKDGLQCHQLTVSDLHDFYWETGKSILFKDRLDSVTSVFVDFSIPWQHMDPLHVQELECKFDAISASAILHVLSSDQCTNFVSNAFRCLKPDCSSTLFGTCNGSPTPVPFGTIPIAGLPGRIEQSRFLHSPQSLEGLLLSVGFRNVCVSVSKSEGSLSEVMKEIMNEFQVEMVRLTFSAQR